MAEPIPLHVVVVRLQALVDLAIRTAAREDSEPDAGEATDQEDHLNALLEAMHHDLEVLHERTSPPG